MSILLNAKSIRFKSNLNIKNNSFLILTVKNNNLRIKVT
jgi:hypothetical protein